MGLIIGAIATLISVFVYTKIQDRGIFNEEKDVNKDAEIYVEEDLDELQKVPGFFVSLLPILIPVFFSIILIISFPLTASRIAEVAQAR